MESYSTQESPRAWYERLSESTKGMLRRVALGSAMAASFAAIGCDNNPSQTPESGKQQQTSSHAESGTKRVETKNIHEILKSEVTQKQAINVLSDAFQRISNHAVGKHGDDLVLRIIGGSTMTYNGMERQVTTQFYALSPADLQQLIDMDGGGRETAAHIERSKKNTVHDVSQLIRTHEQSLDMRLKAKLVFGVIGHVVNNPDEVPKNVFDAEIEREAVIQGLHNAGNEPQQHHTERQQNTAPRNNSGSNNGTAPLPSGRVTPDNDL